MKKIAILFAVCLLISIGQVRPCSATALYFSGPSSYGLGDTLNIDLLADIDSADEIFGFSFDLSFDNGASYVSSPGESGDFLTFTGFQANTILFDDPFPPLWKLADCGPPL